MDTDILLINKFSNTLDSILEIFTAYKNTHDNSLDNEKVSKCGLVKISIMEYIQNLLLLSRNTTILEKFQKYRFYESLIVRIVDLYY